MCQILADRAGAKARLRRIAAAANETAAALRAELETGSLLTPAFCAEVAGKLGGEAGKTANRLFSAKV